MKEFNLQNLFSEYFNSIGYKEICKYWALILVDEEENRNPWIEEKFDEAVEAILENDKVIKRYVDDYWENNRPFTEAETSQYSDEMQIVILKINESLIDIMNEESCNPKNDIDPIMRIIRD